ncbi:ankyrin repeat-containing protein ITN1-like [Helianthus annuus]|uniref:ankyrin repeat-containing protein ITN1-like n=1 Tax=Helianthus annuus TaxID=4232 RepID=UPI000B8FB009|nr:ankyrin repeat-containing protein ITN1-like [Helianthus annuus]
MKIANLLIKEDNSWEKTASWTDSGRCMSKLKPDQMITTAAEVKLFHTADTPLLLATIHDSTEIVREILNIYPQAVEHVDKEGHNILHLAIWHRRYEIIDMVEEMEYPLTRLRGRLDSNYNTLLHMVGHKVDDMKEDIKHPAQELKEDQRLYKRVEKICTTLDMSTRNANQKTAFEVFSEANDKLRAEAKVWMCENSKSCSIVAVLIATVAFTSAYTVPGGPSETGHPVLKGKPMFLLFTLADAISLSRALTSVIVFLNIVTSPFHFKDFASHLFEKQLTTLILLIISVATMMVAFVATLILTISNQGKWSDVTLYAVSFFPVLVFFYSYISDYWNMIVGFFRALKKTMSKIVLGFHNLWDYKPQSTYPVDVNNLPLL